MTYSFESPKVFDKLMLPAGFSGFSRMRITISNPLGEDFSIMRTTAVKRHAHLPVHQLQQEK